MIVIAKNAEKRLLRELRRFDEDGYGAKCFYLAFSRANVPKADLFEAFLKQLNELPESYVAQVFICADKDVFILMRGFMQRQFTRFIKQLADSLGAEELPELAEVFEAGRHKYKIEALCADKIVAIETAEKNRQEQEMKSVYEHNTQAALALLDPDDITQLADKRQQRGEVMVMVADDDMITRTLVGNVLEKEFRICFAKTGREAIIEYSEQAPDVIFLDIGLPDMTGYEVLECIFQIDTDAYVIMFSGLKDKSNIMRALEIGAQGFVGKPFTRDKMFQYIHKSPHVKGKIPQKKGAYRRHVS